MFFVGVVSSPLIDSLSSMLGNAGLVSVDIALRVIFAFLFMIFWGMGPVTAGYAWG